MHLPQGTRNSQYLKFLQVVTRRRCRATIVFLPTKPFRSGVTSTRLSCAEAAEAKISARNTVEQVAAAPKYTLFQTDVAMDG